MKYFVLSLLVLWLLIMALGLYAFGIQGLVSGLDRAHYNGHSIDYLMHWALFLGPPIIAIIFGVFRLFKSR